MLISNSELNHVSLTKTRNKVDCYNVSVHSFNLVIFVFLDVYCSSIFSNLHRKMVLKF